MSRWVMAAVPAALIILPAPAFAADRVLTQASETLADPARQDQIADAVTAMVDALMQINVGPIARAAGRMDPESPVNDIPDDATLGEVAGNDDPYLARRMGDDARAGARMLGNMAATAAVMAPVLKDMVRDMAAQWEQARRDARRR